METLGPQRIDTDRDYILTLRDASGAAVDIGGASSIAAVLTPGPGAPAVATLAAVPLSPTQGTVTLTIAAAALVGLGPGTYDVFVTGTAGGRPLDFAPGYQVTLAGGVATALPPSDPDRARLERAVVSRCGALMAKVGMSLLTGGANPDLDDPIETAMADAGLASLSGVSPAAFGRIKTFAEYRTLRTIRGNWTKSRIQIGANAVYLSDILDALDARLAAMEALPMIRDVNASSFSGGSITLAGSLATDDCDDDSGCDE